MVGQDKLSCEGRNLLCVENVKLLLDMVSQFLCEPIQLITHKRGKLPVMSEDTMVNTQY